MISKVTEKYNRIDILVNVVGGYLGGKSVSELEEQEWDFMMNLNLKSAFLISKHVTSIMASAKYGKMVHVSSRTALKSDGYDSVYAASKSGLIRLVESVSEEVKELNINVNCIMPSIIDTEANRKAMPKSDFSKWIKPEDLANVVLFLCSEDAKVIKELLSLHMDYHNTGSKTYECKKYISTILESKNGQFQRLCACKTLNNREKDSQY